MKDFLINLKTPQTVATVTTSDDLAFLMDLVDVGKSELVNIADIFEFRIDNFYELGELAQSMLLMKGLHAPVLLTARHPSEGGVAKAFAENKVRADLLSKCMRFASLVDVEIAQFDDLASKLEFSCPIVGSSHDFEKPIPLEEIRKQVDFCRDRGIDIAKFAMVIETTDQLSELAEFVSKTVESGQLISAMGMGPLGRESRIELAATGSCLNYGYLQHENAPGQWPAKELKRLISKA